MLYHLQVARRARSVVAAAFGSLGNVELREELPAAADVPAPKHVARAELVLARPSCEPLAMVGLAPDPMQLFARAFASIREDQGEGASVVLDLLPAAAGQRRRLRGRLLAQARSSERQGRGGLLGAVLAVLFPSRAQNSADPQRLSLSDQVERRADARQLASKVLEHDPLFELQVLVRAAARSKERAHGHLEALLSCFDVFSGQNWFRVAGFNLLGLAFRGADASEGSRRRFDRRFQSGLHRPSRHNLVTAREVGALLKPPSKHCQAPNVLRLGGSIPPPPPGLPTFRRQPGLLPLGRISDGDGGQRLIGVPLADTFFTYFAGRSRYGKTETAINQFLHLVRSGHGGLFLDPHEDALQRIKAHLTERHRGVFVSDVTAVADTFASMLRPMVARMQDLGGPPPGGLPFAMVCAASAVHMTGSAQALAAGWELPLRPIPVPVTLPLHDIVERLNALRPPVLYGYSAMLARLAAEQRAGRLRIAPTLVNTNSESLTAEMRTAIAEAFGAPIVDSFGSSEGLVGTSAPDDEVLVFNSDLCIVELVDSENRPIPPGVPSARVLLTKLSNRTQPLIRYELTDSSVRQPDAPEHGHLRATVRGRADAVLHYEGVDIHPHVARSVMVQSPEVLDYQIRQTPRGMDVDALAVVAIDGDRLAECLVEALAGAGLEDPVVTVRIVGHLERLPDTGKLRRFVPLPGRDQRNG